MDVNEQFVYYGEKASFLPSNKPNESVGKDTPISKGNIYVAAIEPSVLGKRVSLADKDEVRPKKIATIAKAKIRCLDTGSSISIVKGSEIGRGKFKKVEFGTLEQTDGVQKHVVFARFIEHSKASVPEREKHMLTKIHQNFPHGTRGLVHCLGVCEWNKGQSVRRGFAFPFYNGQTLVQATGLLSQKEAMTVALDVAYGLQALHHIRILHHDLKHDNICLERDPTTGDVVAAYIIDLGVAADLDSPEFRGPSTTNTAYSSPELVNKIKENASTPITEKSDVYSFGKVLSTFVNTKDGYMQPLADLIVRSQQSQDERPELSEFIDFLELMNPSDDSEDDSDFKI